MSTASVAVPETLLAALVAELDDENTVAIGLGGSYARGTATPYSDLDIAHFVHTVPDPYSKRFTYREGRIVNVSAKSLPREREAVTRPEQAIYAVPAYREVRILLDREGALAAFQRELAAFTWAPLQPAANAFASDMLMLLAEEAHKLLSALRAENAGGLAYATMRICLELTRVLAVQRGIFVTSNSTYLQQVGDGVGQASAWTRAQREAAGLEHPSDGAAPLWARAIAGLRLYAESAALLQPILQPAHRDVVEHTVRVIREARLTAVDARGGE
jgi:predicted nucleotidyltransferase